MGRQHLTQLIRKYLRGKATDDEKRQLDAWWDYNLNDNAYLQSLSNADQQQLFDGMLTNIWQRIEKPADGDLQNIRPLPAPQTRNWAVLRWAAAVGLVLIASILAFQYRSKRPTIETAYGERREVRLPDNSVVMLNGNSSIRYSTWDESAPREVWLRGEAFFTIIHKRNHQRFVVHTPDGLAVEVLGTRFDVNSRHATTQVVLEEGRVRVTRARQQSVVMHPGQQLRYEADKPALVLSKTDVSRQLSWRESQLLFDNEPLSTVFDRLRDSHGLRVEIRAEGLAEQPFSGSVPVDNVEQIFTKIKKIYRVNIRQEGQQFIIE